MDSLERSSRNILELREIEIYILQYREKLESVPCQNIRDVMDTRPYQELIRSIHGCTDSSIQSLTLLLFLDAAEISKTSKSSVYPLMIAIDELPPFLRGSNLIAPLLSY